MSQLVKLEVEFTQENFKILFLPSFFSKVGTLVFLLYIWNTETKNKLSFGFLIFPLKKDTRLKDLVLKLYRLCPPLLFQFSNVCFCFFTCPYIPQIDRELF